MRELSWDLPKTEEGLQQALLQIEECRVAEDFVQLGDGLLALSFLVKWVRSDTDLPPFPRSQEIALEAVEVFRKTDSVKGLIRALVNASSALAVPGEAELMLTEAEALAASAEDENLIASVLAARARLFHLHSRDKAIVLYQQVLEIYRRTGNKQGIAQTLFSLSLGTASAETRDFALQAAQLKRELGAPDEAARCMGLAFLNAEQFTPLETLEGMARIGLQDAWDSGKRSLEKGFYTRLARVMVAKGDLEEAAKYQRFAAELRDSDGLSEFERWENDAAMCKMLVSTSKVQRNKEAVKMFSEELKRLKSIKPKG